MFYWHLVHLSAGQFYLTIIFQLLRIISFGKVVRYRNVNFSKVDQSYLHAIIRATFLVTICSQPMWKKLLRLGGEQYPSTHLLFQMINLNYLCAIFWVKRVCHFEIVCGRHNPLCDRISPRGLKTHLTRHTSRIQQSIHCTPKHY